MNRYTALLCLVCVLLLPTCETAAVPEAPEPSPVSAEAEVPVAEEQDHSHAPAAQPLTVEDPVSGYCGNTVTQVTVEGETYSFWGSDSVTLTDLLINLAYDPEALCRCLPQYTVDTEFGSGYGVSLSGSYARCADGQAALTEEQAEIIRGILDRNCG